jgi:hypothetical protein
VVQGRLLASTVGSEFVFVRGSHCGAYQLFAIHVFAFAGEILRQALARVLSRD